MHASSRLFKLSSCLAVAVALGLLGITLFGALHKDRTAIPSGMVATFLETGKARLRFHQGGQGQDLLLIHGAMGTIEDWEAVIPPLEKHFRVSAIDRPGQGFSNAGSYPAHIGGNLHAIEDVIRAAQLRDVILVGHSYGAAIALGAALRKMPAIRGLVLIGAAAYSEPEPDAMTSLLALPALGRGAAVIRASWMGRDNMRGIIRDAFSPGPVPQGYMETRLEWWSRPLSAVTWAKETIAFNREIGALIKGYSTLTLPIAIVHGEKDAWLRGVGKRLHEDIPGSLYFEVKEAGHLPHYTNPDTVVKAALEVSKRTRSQQI